MKASRLASISFSLLTVAICVARAQQQSPQVRTSLTLGRPIQSGVVGVVPILVRVPLSQEKYMTLAQATREGLVEIVEIPGREQVNSLEVRNRANLPLLVFAGELLLGGKQDRIVGKDTIIPARESRQVPVFCVEHGRWQGAKMSFEAADTLVPDAVRSSAYGSQSQREVWDKVAMANAKAGTSTSTGTVQALLRDPKVAREVESTTRALQTAFSGVTNATGVISWLNGKVHSADVFANPDLFAANRDKLLRSYALDAKLSTDPVLMAVNMKECAEFLDAIVQARRTQEEHGQYGALFRIKDGKVVGYESGRGGFGGGLGGGGVGGGYGHGSYKPGR